MKELSIFVDESGDFGKYNPECPYYLVSLVLHEQQYSIKEEISRLDLELLHINKPNHTIHTGPLIRREKSYLLEDYSTRFKIFNILFNFTRKVKIQYKSLVIHKNKSSNSFDININLSKQLASFLRDNYDYLRAFDHIYVYYDNGQYQLTQILVSIFSSIIDKDVVEFRSANQDSYKLFQCADLICTLSLLELKLSESKLSVSEEKFFGGPRKLNKNYLKHIQKLQFKSR